ncbi:phosphate ABC transporter permease PstA [Methanococcus maripaludis]|uniref:Phosphate transport system permease protein PstA n=1 Tax=Methanococcus maripaludis TaxID=39152 RepID=A0A2L1CCR6_METMI|nr:phosphate ABC transporter permease PstA [Methanococcus maripaludis]AVB77119.1 Phosphate transport system permease protein PstA [Methanococcus maripaludis]MBA2863631.1 phosphate transport system permease protein [Methanococcus maripaludis]MBB6496363.1 phosphate transport system permease protein [Methanococcus maripaludis]
MNNSKKAKIEENIVFGIFYLFAFIVVGILFTIVGYVFINGIGAINMEFFFGDANPINVILGVERSFDGIWNSIIGTIALVVLSILLAIPFGVLGAIYLHEYASDNKLTQAVRFSSDSLAGLPSIVFGIFGYALAIKTVGPSLLIGGLTLSFMVLPIIMRATEEGLKSVAPGLREGSLALGATKWQTIKKVVIPSALPQMITGIILAMGRSAEETAAIMFTAATAFSFGIGLFNRVETLSFSLYVLSTEYSNAEELKMAYGIALVLIAIMFVLFTIANVVKNRFKLMQS